ncbi:fumarylacetoacetate hydrolase family protein [Kineococcus arenarius]|uniref:fumarylacetoacetate hydrolase family protein n=1 Tax=unclassified Kineococcus TaxID=2621656 RepID=UPI003D7CEF9C
MKIVGFARPGSAEVLVGELLDGAVRPLTSLAEFWAAPRRWAVPGQPGDGPAVAVEEVELRPVVPPSARVLCIGLNYRAHAAEGGFTPPEFPTVFGRWTASLTAGEVPAPVPQGEDGLDWEGEVMAYVAEDLADADPDSARAAVLGYSTFNDLTARRAQKLTAQWTLGKNADRSGPTGPLVTADEVGDLRDGLAVRTRVNGETVQDGNTRDMVFDVGTLLSLVSRTLTLHPGDVVATGTPEGVGYVRNPPWLLQPGDVVEVDVERLGVLRTPIVDAGGRKGA